MKPLTLIIDMQNDFFKEEPLKGTKEKITKNINDLILDARNKHIPIIWIKQEHKADLSDANLHTKKTNRKITIRGTFGAQILDKLNRQEDELIIIKKRYSAFFRTELEKLIKEKHIDTLILCGINTHACIRTTAIDAFQRDIEVIIAKDCIGSWNKKHHDISLSYFENNMGIRILSNKQLKQLVK